MSSFSLAVKTTARDIIYNNHHKTFYCECDFTPTARGVSGTINSTACGYKIKHIESRGARIEWEHIVPASTFGKHRNFWFDHNAFQSCAKISSRECARKLDAEYRMMEADLHNLAPAIGELNADRSNLPYGIIDGEQREYGDCDFEIGFDKDGIKVAEPAEHIRGEVARVWLYMFMTYGSEALSIEYENLELFCDWHQEHPTTHWEVEKNLRISNYQGNSNPYVDGSYAECQEACQGISTPNDEL